MANQLRMDERIEIDPRVDFACKRILGNELHTKLTVQFLNAVLEPLIKIKTAVIKNSISDKEYEDDKISVFDILATDENGTIYNIEIQRLVREFFPERVTYYGAIKISDQLSEGQSHGDLRRVVVICIVDNLMLPKDLPYHNEFRLRTRAGRELTDLFQIDILELPKYVPSSDNEPIVGELDQWMYFFANAHGSTPRELLKRLTDSIFIEVLEILQMIQRTPEERMAYDQRIKAERDYLTDMQAAEARGEARGKVQLPKPSCLDRF